VYTDENPNTMKVNWQLLTICYALNKDNTEQEAEKLLYKLQQRDLTTPPHDKEVEAIKLSVVATLIMQITRRESDGDKRLIKAFCDKLLYYRKLYEA
jgi:hypothetical protein